MTKFLNKTYDLEERTAKFAEKIIDLCKKVQKSVITTPVVDQLLRAGTSIGANYMEANGASSKKDFKNEAPRAESPRFLAKQGASSPLRFAPGELHPWPKRPRFSQRSNKIFVCKKESKETEYWLRLLSRNDERLSNDCRALWKEAHELTLIFSKIASSTS